MNQHAKRRAQAAMRAPDLPPAPAAAPLRAPISTLPISAIERDGGEIAFTVEDQDTGLRLDRLLSDRLAAAGSPMSRTRLKALIEANAVALDGVSARDPAAKARPGQVLVLVVPAATPAIPTAEDIPLSIVFEDDSLIVIDKPAGLVVHPAAGHESGTLVNALIAHCGDSLSGVGGVRRPGVVHRLDKDTSGLIVVAKTDAAHRGLATLFADHGRSLGLVREYLALVWGAPERTAGVIDAPIGRHPHMRERQAIVRQRGRDAVTHWRVERVFRDKSGRNARAALLRCRLETGRTHQIRVHLASIGHPVVADALYAAAFKTKCELLAKPARAALDALGRQALHAAILGFPHPISGEVLSFESAPPEAMRRLIAALDESCG